MNSELNTLAATPGVRALCYQRGPETVYHTFSPAYGPATADALSRAVARLHETYAKGQRRMAETWFQFPEGGVLILAAPEGRDAFLSFMLSDTAAIPVITGPGKAFLARNG